MWSTNRYDVSTAWSPKRNITTPETIHLRGGPGCIATSGIDGFTQDAWRIFKRDEVEVGWEKFSHRYRAEPNFLCDR